MKRKYADRSDWQRILERSYKCIFIEEEKFTGYVAFLRLVKTREPLWVTYDAGPIRIVDDNYVWLQFFPVGGHSMLTAMFDDSGQLVQCYFDVVRKIALSERNVPYGEDMFLDIVSLPSGAIYTLDEDELLEACRNRVISQSEFDQAVAEGNRIRQSITSGTNHLVNHVAAYYHFMKDI
jgi:hypothetical protein